MTKSKIYVVVFFLIGILFISLYKLNFLREDRWGNAVAQGIEIREYLGLDTNEFKLLNGKGVTVAILDSGLSIHKDIDIDRIVAFKDFVNNNSEMYDDNGHGTFIAGILGSNGNYKGIAPKISFVILKVIDSSGNSNYDTLNTAMNWLIKNKNKYNISVVNLSLGMKRSPSPDNDPVGDKIKTLKNMGAIIVTSSGNNGPGEDTIMYPGVLEDIITVGYVNNKHTLTLEDDNVAVKSGRGSSLSKTTCKPDLVTLGVDVKSLSRENGYATESGSSYSTAIVSGIISLLVERYKYDTSLIETVLFSNTKVLENTLKCSQGQGQLYFGEIRKE